jgi:hypothetical protein
MALGGGDLVDYYMGLERRVARLERTTSVSNSQSDTTYVGTLSISGLTVANQTVVAYGTDNQVYITFSWNALSIDPNVITDDPFIGYFTSFTKDGTNWSAEAFTTNTSVMIGPLAMGQTITFRVRAVTQKNTLGAYATLGATTTLDSVAPGQPSTPTAMPVDLVVTEIHMSTVSITFTPTPATLVDTFYPGGGYTTITDLAYGTTYYFRLVAVDKVGNRSVSSTGASVVPVQAADGDIASLNVGKLVAGTLSADITVSARIKTANSGSRVELNSSGLQAFNAGNTQTVLIDSASGNASILGTFRTGTSGQRIEIDSTGFGTIAWYPTTGTDYAWNNAPASNSIGVNSGYQATGKGTRLFCTPSSGELVYLTQPGQVQAGGGVNVSAGGVSISALSGDSIELNVNSGQAQVYIDSTQGFFTSPGAMNVTAAGDMSLTTSGSYVILGRNSNYYLELGNTGLVSLVAGGSTYLRLTSTTSETVCTAFKAWGIVSTANAANMFYQGSNQQLYVNSSSRTIKSEIEDANDNALIAVFERLRPVTFYDKRDYEEVGGDTDLVQQQLGLIAEEVEEIGGAAMLLTHWQIDGYGDEMPHGVTYDRAWLTLVPVLQKLWADYKKRTAA